MFAAIEMREQRSHLSAGRVSPVPVDTNHDWGGDKDWLQGESGWKLRRFCSRVIFPLFYCHLFAGKKALSPLVQTMRIMTTASQAGNSDSFAVV